MELNSIRITKNALWKVYLIAFGLLVATVSTSHFVADRIVKQQEQYASIINISGRQRMLSQRITGLIAEAFLETDAEIRHKSISLIDQSINLMETSHAMLTRVGDVKTSGEMSDEIQKIYFGEEVNLDQKVKAFISKAMDFREKAFNGQEPEKTALIEFAANGFGPLLAQLDNAVSQYESDAENELNRLRTLNLLLWVFTIAVIILELFVIFRPLIHRLDKAQRELEDIAHTDPLTGCWNRRALMQSGDGLWSLAKRQERDFSVVICDIDKFKNINDTYGHGVGDEAIKTFASTCLSGLREYDLLGRFGGEEFVLVLPDTGEDGAKIVAERIRAAQEELVVEADAARFKMTASFGTASITQGDTSLQAMIDRADEALYRAKENGRNRVECAS